MLPTQPETIGGAKKVEREERAKTQVRYLSTRNKGLIETLFSHSETSVVWFQMALQTDRNLRTRFICSTSLVRSFLTLKSRLKRASPMRPPTVITAPRSSTTDSLHTVITMLLPRDTEITGTEATKVGLVATKIHKTEVMSYRSMFWVLIYPSN